MLFRLSALWGRIRRALSRSEWAVRLLRLPRTPRETTAPGLVLIQIDGLSRTQLETAIAGGRMRFLRRLLRRDDYALHSLYSGLPSTTPAVQAELFYGVRGAVPAFGFRDEESGELTSMLVPPTVEKIQRELEKNDGGLLAGGAAWSDIFTGGADKGTFCYSTLGLSHVLRAARPWALLAVFLLHGFIVVRMALLGAIEVALALFDAVRGALQRGELVQELEFVPRRVAVSILLRELVALGARIDAARGVPVIHCNFVGYDEQAHVRGPESRFAHWTLKGIDRAIRSIHAVASRSCCRDYDVWIHADHGQEHPVPFPVQRGVTIQEAVARVAARHGVEGARAAIALYEAPLERSFLLGGRLFQQILDLPRRKSRKRRVKTSGMGPVGHVYFPGRTDPEKAAAVANDLVRRAGVPAVLARDGPERAVAWTENGRFELPGRIDAVVGADHPFRGEIRPDLLRLVHHHEAGDLVLLGWKPEGENLTFTGESGSHGGPGRGETHAFVLAPRDAPLPLRGWGFARPLDLRQAALRRMGRRKEPPRRVVSNGARLRVMTYNVHSCVGRDGKVFPERIARVIEASAPDLVALQEMDAGCQRTGGTDQPREIARALAMDHVHLPLVEVERGRYGNALLSRLPLRLVKSGRLPGRGNSEARGALWAQVEVGGRKLNVVTTHLSLRPRERFAQVRALMGEAWIGGTEPRGPLILLCDLNAPPGSRSWREVTGTLRDGLQVAGAGGFSRTWMGWSRFDYVFVTGDVEVLRFEVPCTPLTRTASDHYPVVADLLLP